MPRYSVPVIVKISHCTFVEVDAADENAARAAVRDDLSGPLGDEAIGNLEENLYQVQFSRDDLEVPDTDEWPVEEA